MAETRFCCNNCIWWDFERVLKDPILRKEPIGLCTFPDHFVQGRFTTFDYSCRHFCFINKEKYNNE